MGFVKPWRSRPVQSPIHQQNIIAVKYKALLPLVLGMLLLTVAADAQVRFGTRMGGRFGGRRPHARNIRQLPPFTPSLQVSVGYGFPALDKTYLPDYYNAYQGHTSQTGPVNVSVDYQFSRMMSAGVLVTHNKVSAPYYNYNNNGSPDFTAKLNNWGIMLNLVRYIPAGKTVAPYLRTAIGINSWQQDYTDANGKPINMPGVSLPDFAYQAGIGAKFYLTPHAGLFAEVGYGKYIAQAGLAFKF